MSALILAVQIIIAVAGIAAVAYGAFVAINPATVDLDEVDARLAAKRKAQPKRHRTAYDNLTDAEIDDWYYSTL